MASVKHNKCPHLENILQLSSWDQSELCKSKQGSPCSECTASGPNLWVCLYKTCLYVGCSEQYNDHSTKHFQSQQLHCIHMNLSSQRTWCYLCESEVFITSTFSSKQRRNSMISNESSDTNSISRMDRQRGGGGGGDYDRGGGDSCESSCDEEVECTGLVGLQNIANTCYMNAAIQALSNSPPLTRYFLDCGDFIDVHRSSMMNSNQKFFGLAKSYQQVIKEMWGKNRRAFGYVVPSGILKCIRNVHPMFRGFQQHDTQEFLRCFMDQLHEELKEVTPPPPDTLFNNNNNNKINHIDQEDELSSCSSQSPSQSEGEYETCDSGVSEQSSLSDEGLGNRRRSTSIGSYSTHFKTSSPTPSSASSLLNINQRNRNVGSASSLGSMQQNIGNASGVSLSSGSSTVGGNTSKGSGDGSSGMDKDKLPHRSIISEVFDGKLLSSVQCLTCDRISSREETFQDLSLPIPNKDHLAMLHQNQSNVQIAQQHQQQHQQSSGSCNGGGGGVTCSDAVYQASQDGWLMWFWNLFRSLLWGPPVSLHDCMAAFFSADELKGDNMYSCEKCKKLRNGIKYSRVLALPEMLCVHLKRFRHDLSYSSKISSPVHFPLVGLDMKPYLHRDCKSEISTYDLTAVICHHGTVGGGHYTCYAKHQATKKWFEYDDQLITEVSPDTVENCEAYVLFYRKTNHKMTMLRNEVQRIASSIGHQPLGIPFYISRQWLNRFNTFAEPGPIDNWALLCPHGGLPPYKANHINRLVHPLSQAIWDFLYEKFGGGPACNHLFECDTCREAAEALANRQNNELMAFAEHRAEYQLQENPSTIYAISMAWFRQWQLFANGRTPDDPGPINNAGIAGQSETLPIRCVRPGSDYAQINTTLWKFFHGIYGGGPEIILRGGDDKIPKCQDQADENLPPEQPEEVVVTQQPIQAPKTKSIHTISPSSSVFPPIKSSPNNREATIVASTKVTKNVSFDVNEMDLDGVASDVTSSDTASTINASSVKRSKKETNSSSETTEGGATTVIGSKKDKKYRAMNASGFFGPEGRYIEHSSTNGDDHQIDEIMPLLNQTKITNCMPSSNITKHSEDLHQENIMNGPTITTTTNTTTSLNKNLKHKTNHRKKIKNKSGRKVPMSNNSNHQNNHIINNDSDSG